MNQAGSTSPARPRTEGAPTWGPVAHALVLHPGTSLPTPPTDFAKSRPDWSNRDGGRRALHARVRTLVDGDGNVPHRRADGRRPAALGRRRHRARHRDRPRLGVSRATGLPATPDSPFAKAVIMSLPPPAALRRSDGTAERTRLASRPAGVKLLRSWYITYFQSPRLPKVPRPGRATAAAVVARLSRQEDLRHYVDAAIGTPESWRAALGPYRATIRRTPRHSAQYAELRNTALLTQNGARAAVPGTLHGRDDGCSTRHRRSPAG